MILPSKHIPAEQALIGVGAAVLRYIERQQTITSLWDKVRDEPVVGTFERFILGLDFLYVMGVIDLSKGMIHRTAI
ncbi:MAG: hypothetical protein KDB14_27105 [Planctomycetales bacterium]|nr:hypothetical protein [Planctomycetales bacterium]